MEKQERIVTYHVFLLFPLVGNEGMTVERGVESSGSWNISCENVPDRNNIFDLQTKYARRYLTFSADEDHSQKEIIIHTYLSETVNEKTTRTYEATIIDLTGLNYEHFDNIAPKLDATYQIAWDCPYVQLTRNPLATPIPNLVSFIPKVIIPCLGCKMPESPDWKGGLVDKKQIIGIPTGRNSFRTFVPLIKTGANQIGIITDLAINEAEYFESGQIDGVFEPTVIWVNDERLLPSADALYNADNNLKDIKTEWNGGVLASVHVNNPDSLPVGNRPRARGSKTFSLSANQKKYLV